MCCNTVKAFRIPAILCVLPVLAFSAGLSVGDLKCEYKTDPIGIDDPMPRLSWILESDRRGTLQTAYEIRVAGSPAGLKSGSACIWATGRRGSEQSVHVPYEGPAPASGQRFYWQVRVWDNRGRKSEWSAPAFWEAGLLNPSDWKASWIEPDLKEDTTSNPCPMLRREFAVRGVVKSARAYITCRGLYEAELNGTRIGDVLFTPGWTAYQKRLQYQTYDVTGLLRPGENAVGVLLGDGWHRGYLDWSGRNRHYGDRLALLLQIHILYEDGTDQWVLSDSGWKSSTGPIRMSDIYHGETYDARLEKPGWSRAGYDDSAWEGVRQADAGAARLIAPAGPPVKRMEEVHPVKILKTPEGETVFDMGQNMVGWVRLKIEAPRGTAIVLKHAEALDKNGNFYTANLRSAKQTVRYFCRGSGVETFEPHFTFQGFRYVSVSGFPHEPGLGALTGVVIHSNIQPTGSFSCSNPLVNQLQHNIQWGQKGNFVDVPTDCPQRDERMGWTGDAQVFARTACFNADVAGFFTKWLGDLAADQLTNGAVPHVIPDVLGKPGSPAAGAAGWADAAVVVPWTVYQCYGDRRILERQYPSMKAWVEYMRARAATSHVDPMLWNVDYTFGDWLAFHSDRSDYPGATTDMDFISAAYFARSTDLLQRTAVALGKQEDAEQYGALLEKIKAAFVREFISENGRVANNTQTCYAIALGFGLVPEPLREMAVKRFGWAVNMFGPQLTTGFLGTPLLCPVLTQCGRLEDAYDLVNRKEYPSWLYPVTAGATTIWERWDGIKPDGSFQDPGMNSLNHYAYGAIGEWLYRFAAGIEIDEKNPGYKHILIQPHPGGGWNRAGASLETLYGRVASEWEIRDGKMSLSVEIPVNTDATLFLPAVKSGTLTEGGKALSKSEGIKPPEDGKRSILQAGSGRYVFSWTME
ncbi:family 78 glycoside hydrolase catalytic domain [bacterium]|nr:family 78 glycoside hydrolase catalytic domain [bacterium]